MFIECLVGVSSSKRAGNEKKKEHDGGGGGGCRVCLACGSISSLIHTPEMDRVLVQN